MRDNRVSSVIVQAGASVAGVIIGLAVIYNSNDDESTRLCGINIMLTVLNFVINREIDWGIRPNTWAWSSLALTGASAMGIALGFASTVMRLSFFANMGLVMGNIFYPSLGQARDHDQAPGNALER